MHAKAFRLPLALAAITFPTAYAQAQEPDYWAVEKLEERLELPLYKTIPAATAAELTAANGYPKITELDWRRSHGGDENLRFSTATQITRENVHQLEVAWTFHAGGEATIQCNPIIANGVLYTPIPGDGIVAIDAATGQELWRHQPEFERNHWFYRTAYRGLTHVEANGRQLLLFCSGEYLIALDAQTGEQVQKFKTGFFAVAPVLHGNWVIAAGFEEDVFAYDLTTGKRAWTFYTRPRKGEPGHETWDTVESGANTWGGMAFDRQRGIVYVATGSPKPNFFGMGHRGDNLYSNCVIAVDANTGKRLWHFQEMPHDIWDLDLPAPPILLTVMRDGKQVDAVAQLSKTGNTLLLDRTTGKPLFPFRMRRAPVSDIPGEQTAPYQADLQLPEPFAKQEFRLQDVTQRTPEARAHVLATIQKATWGWFQPPSVHQPVVYFGIHGGAQWTGGCVDPRTGRLYVNSNEIPWIVAVSPVTTPERDEAQFADTPGRKAYETYCMACHGDKRQGIGTNPPLKHIASRRNVADIQQLIREGKNLMPPMPFLSDAQVKDITSYLLAFETADGAQASAPAERPKYKFHGWTKLLDHQDYPGSKPPWGTLNCIDLNTGKLLWQKPLGEYEELSRQGLPSTGTENFGGPSISAGGLVFCSGTRDDKIRAFDADTGEELWQHKLPFRGSAPPTIYQIHGKQFIVIPATGGGKLGQPTGDAFVAFALPE